jgi:hypothetical protein
MSNRLIRVSSERYRNHSRLRGGMAKSNRVER